MAKKAAKAAKGATNRGAGTTPPDKRPRPATTSRKPINRAEGVNTESNAAASPNAFKVRAKRMGFYDNKRIRQGDVFLIADEKDFSKKWMTRVDASTPERITPGVQELKARNAQDLAKRRAGGGSPSVTQPADDPIGDEEDEEEVDSHGPRA